MLVLFFFALISVAHAAFTPIFPAAQHSTSTLHSTSEIESYFDTQISNEQYALPAYLKYYKLTGKKFGREGESVAYEIYHSTLLINLVMKISVHSHIEYPECEMLPEVSALLSVSKLNLNAPKYVSCAQSGHGVFYIL